MKLYVGVRTELDRRVVVPSSIGQFADYPLSAKLNNHPINFEWGPVGAGRRRRSKPRQGISRLGEARSNAR